ncbi:helix-turn-helix transcriptional regulator [Thalassoroseus pseudoceratinae]|uniref:helix-turn-helix transcriptional regulator n=1 Tax=Thalassoroseus pseudoceratinae TaxID=2713176 RepID=UPI001422842C|nr:WYL domain-containing protein [Thalassoroseus pseudoceratinae]
MAPQDRLLRLLRIVRLLQSGRPYTSTELAKESDVSQRTIFRDLQLLQRAGIVYSRDESDTGYVLQDATLLPSTDFTLAETLALLVLCNQLGDTTKGIPFQRDARSAALKLLSSLPGELRDELSELTQSISIDLGPHNTLHHAHAAYDALTMAISDGRKIHLHYGSLSSEGDIETTLSPYHLLFKNRSWYVVGYSQLHDETRIFNVGRIQKWELLAESFECPASFKIERFLGNAWALIPERGRRTRVVLRFQPMVAKNVAEVRWHKTQQIFWNDDGTLEFQVVVDGLTEIRWWILGYGAQVEVLEPLQLRNNIRDSIEQMRQIYAEDD